jgi:hypothetical protein
MVEHTWLPRLLDVGRALSSRIFFTLRDYFLSLELRIVLCCCVRSSVNENLRRELSVCRRVGRIAVAVG